MKALLPLVFCFILVNCASTTEKQTPKIQDTEETSAPQVILKLDDLEIEPTGGIHEGWKQVVQHLDERNISASIGIICSSLREPTPEYLTWIAQRKADGHEFWNHGFCHCREVFDDGSQIAEFGGKSYEDQHKALIDGQRLAKEHLGFSFTAFGAPFNAIDSVTALALANTPDLKYWLYNHEDYPSDLINVPRAGVDLEYPVHVPNLDSVKFYFDQNRDAKLLTLQGHPRSWVDKPERMQAFIDIVDYLQGEGCEFIRIEDL
jgi:peptidoglycan/xylan/chitin deacetylase (PgdA/CDA1 family)